MAAQTTRARWRFVLILAIFGVAIVAAAAAGWRYARVTSSPANGPVIIIAIDALRADRLPVYGYAAIKTPAIDALADDAVVFERAYAHSPLTLPSTVGILSGLLPFEHGVRDDAGFHVGAELRLLPHWLKPRGIPSAGVVSSAVLSRDTGLAAGFDFFDSAIPAASREAVAERRGEESVAVAQQWIKKLGSPRFFLFLHLNEPNRPYAPPEQFARYEPYDGEVAHADAVVGRFISWLKGRGLYDRATIVLLANHGEGFGEHGEHGHGMFLYEETLRVPLIVKLAREASHRHVTARVQHIDVAPTILDLVGAPRPDGLRGRSLRPLLEGATALDGSDTPPFYAESLHPRYRFGWSELAALTEGQYRYVKAPREELYDLGADPGERTNIASRRGDVRTAMRAALDALLRPALPQPGAPTHPGAPPAAERAPQELVASDVPFERLPDPKDKIPVLDTWRRACELAALGRFPDAIPLFREVAASEPGVPAVWRHLGVASARSGRFGDAVEAFKRAIAIAPDDAEAFVGAGAALLKLGRLDEARAQGQVAVKGARAAAHELLARIALRRNDPEEAASQALLAQEADASLPMPVFVEAMLLHREGKYEEALPVFQKAVAAAKDRPTPVADLHSYTADTLARLEKYPEAEQEFKEEIRLFPENGQARASLAMLYHAQGRDTDAAPLIEDLLRTTPTAEAYATAARLWTILGERERAAEIRAQAKEQFGRTPAAPRPR